MGEGQPLQRRYPQSDLRRTYNATRLPVIDLPIEIYDMITALVARHNTFENHHFEGIDDLQVSTRTHYVPRPIRSYTHIDRRQLALLRLVNRKLCHSASPFYFQRIDATRDVRKLKPGSRVDFSPLLAFSRTEYDFSPLLAFSRTEYACQVRELVLGIRRWNDDDTPYWMNPRYCVAVKNALPELLQAFRRLELMTFVGPEIDCSFRVTAPVSKETAKLLAKKVLQVFLVCPTRESLPTFHTMINEAPVLQESLIMKWQIQELGSEKTYRTDFRRSSVDHIYAKVLFPISSMPTDLKHLCIQFGHHKTLDLDVLNSSSFTSLQILELGGILVSQVQLLTMLSNSKTSLRAVDLQLVQLKTGTWEDVFHHLCSFPLLEYLYIDACGYGRPRGHNFWARDLATGYLTSIEEPKVIETKHQRDYSALGDLQQHVMGVREVAGLEMWTDKDFTIFCPTSEKSSSSL